MFDDHTAYIQLGTNLGQRSENLKKAKDLIQRFIGTISSCSSIYKTAAWGKTDQPDFLNLVLVLTTKLPPFELLFELQNIEEKMDRKRVEHWGSRTIDLDILFYDDITIDYQQLKIPHPLIEQRRFVLEPLLEIAVDFIHPKSGKSIKELSTNCTDQSLVLLLNE